MAQTLSTQECSVGELLSGNLAYELPDFQRDYQWTEANADRLLEDLETAIDERAEAPDSPPYFLGTMLFSSPDEEQSVRSTLIIDGQQRLITFTILLAVLRDLERDKAESQRMHRMIAVWSTDAAKNGDNFHLAPRSQDRGFFSRAIQKLGATRAMRRSAVLSPETVAQQNMWAVRNFFLRQLKGPERTDLRRRLVDLIMDHTRVMVMRCDNLDYAYRIFLTINTRGQPLTDDDIVVAEVIGPLSQEERARYQPIAEQIARYRSKDDSSQNRDKTFFTHLIAVQGWRRSSMFRDLKRAVRLQGGPTRFTQDVFRPYAEAYLLTRCAFDGRAVSPEVAERFHGLALLEQCADDEWVATAMLAIKTIGTDEARLLPFLSALDRYAHALVLCMPKRPERRKKFAAINRAFREDPAAFDPSAAFRLTDVEQASAIRTCETRLSNAPNRSAKAILLRIEAHLSGRPLASFPDYFSEDLPKSERLSVEHIVPRGPTLPATSAWRHVYPDPDLRKPLAEYLGNLTLINEENNQSRGQDDWSIKRAAFEGDPLTGTFLSRDLVEDVHWSHARLQERHARMMDAVQTIFDLKGTIRGMPSLTGRPDPASSKTRPRRKSWRTKRPQ
ncbi:MAG: DUF262 domain-containing HNH endonuclease family protein [Pseudomonadota bacterium]